MNSDLSINNNMIKESKGIIRQEEITNYVFKKRCDEKEIGKHAFQVKESTMVTKWLLP